MYAMVPKAANSTLRRLLWRHLGVDVSGPSLHRTLYMSSGPYAALPDLAHGERRRILKSPDVFRFSFVRNPYDRLRSAYIQKLHHPTTHERPAHYLAALGLSEIPDFETFVRTVVAQPDHLMNAHWRPQHRCLVMDAIAYDFIGKVETFEADFAYVSERLDFSPDLYRQTPAANRARPDTRDLAIYTDALAELVHRRYRLDFDRFDYAKDSYRRPDPRSSALGPFAGRG
jgi:hypothetical protein